MGLRERLKSKGKGKVSFTLYLWWALIAALGAPLGWFIIETLAGFTPAPPYRLVVYLYITLGTALAFVLFAAALVTRMEKEKRLYDRIASSEAELARKEEAARREMELTKERMLKINQFGAVVGRSTKEEEVYYNLAHAAHVALGFDRVIIFKRVDTGLAIVEARGIKPKNEEEVKTLERLIIPCSEEGGSIGIACKEKRSFIFTTNDYIPPKHRLPYPYSEIEVIRSKSFLLVPIKVEGEEHARAVVGADRKLTKREVTTEDLLLLEILADIAGTTLTRLTLEERLEALATIDGLTGIYNRRTWMERAENELERAIRYKYPFSVVMLDIDDFKRVNDTWGHQAGDKVLRSIGLILKNNCRKVDVPGRYGGEEFVLLLPHTDGEAAREVAERIRKALEVADMGVPTKITATFGVAWFNPEKPDTTIDQLLLRADKALYRGKDLGKNIVMVSWEEGGVKDETGDLSHGGSPTHGRDAENRQGRCHRAGDQACSGGLYSGKNGTGSGSDI